MRPGWKLHEWIEALASPSAGEVYVSLHALRQTIFHPSCIVPLPHSLFPPSSFDCIVSVSNLIFWASRPNNNNNNSGRLQRSHGSRHHVGTPPA